MAREVAAKKVIAGSEATTKQRRIQMSLNYFTLYSIGMLVMMIS